MVGVMRHVGVGRWVGGRVAGRDVGVCGAEIPLLESNISIPCFQHIDSSP